MENENKSSNIGAIIGIIIIVIILIIGGWYFIGNRVEEIQENRTGTGEIQDIQTGTSTEVSDIEADLENMNINALDQE